MSIDKAKEIAAEADRYMQAIGEVLDGADMGATSICLAILLGRILTRIRDDGFDDFADIVVNQMVTDYPEAFKNIGESDA